MIYSTFATVTTKYSTIETIMFNRCPLNKFRSRSFVKPNAKRSPVVSIHQQWVAVFKGGVAKKKGPCGGRDWRV